LEEGNPEELLGYIRTYADRVENDKRREKAMELYEDLNNNREGLLPYQKRGIKIPESLDGVIYKHMGTQENQNCTVITLRMKHRKMRESGGQVRITWQKHCTGKKTGNCRRRSGVLQTGRCIRFR